MELVKITDLVNQLGISSRSLRYYEQVGLIHSTRPNFEKYRFYDNANVERLKQIMLLRKMEIPVRDILRIYESADMSVVVETFVKRIRAIDEEVDALTELRAVVDDFLQAMLQNGVTKISALPLLYEQMEIRLENLERRKPTTYGELSVLSDKLAGPINYAIIDLPSMRVLTSFRKHDTKESDFAGFSRYIQANGLSQAASGNHRQFEFQTEAGDVLMVRVTEDFVNDSEYLDYTFDGGLFAAANVYLDEDLGGRFRSLVRELDANPYYQFAYCESHDGSTRHPAMLENLISPDEKRELVSLLVPVKKRMANPALFDAPEEVTGITIAEIEAANPVLWAADVELNKLTQTHPQNSHFTINEVGEAEFIGWIRRAVLNTNTAVKLPFRVDITFRQDSENGEGIAFYHGEDTGYHSGNWGSKCFAVNTGNNNEITRHALLLHQPIFLDTFDFPERGRIKAGEPNHITWILGEKHLAVIINDEVRYCGVNFPYMSLDLRHEAVQPIVIGILSEAGSKHQPVFIRSIRVSQLAETPKNKVKQGELTMITKQSNNIIPVIHRLVTDEYGENYWFNGCAKYVMECLGKPDYDYCFFAGLTGDVFTQHYTYTKYSGDALTSYMMNEKTGGKPARFVGEIFGKCGYAATFVHNRDLQKNIEMYLNTLIAYIDKGIPVIAWGQHLVGVFVGYEDYGKVLLYITGNKNEPEQISLEKLLQSGADNQIVWEKYDGGWIFVGVNKKTIPLAKIYREAIKAIPQHMNVKTDIYCFGAEAFREMANGIERGKFDSIKPDEFDVWAYYTNFICVLATNGSCCHEFLKRARELNPDMGFLDEISKLYKRTADMWNNDNGTDLEALGGGFNVTLATLQDKEKRGKIAAKLREFAACADEVVRIVNENMSE